MYWLKSLTLLLNTHCTATQSATQIGHVMIECNNVVYKLIPEDATWGLLRLVTLVKNRIFPPFIVPQLEEKPPYTQLISYLKVAYGPLTREQAVLCLNKYLLLPCMSCIALVKHTMMCVSPMYMVTMTAMLSS